MHVCMAALMADGLKRKREPQWKATGKKNKGNDVTNRTCGGIYSLRAD